MQRREHRVTFRIDSETLERLQINAVAHDRVLSAEVRRALRLYVRQLDNAQRVTQKVSDTG